MFWTVFLGCFAAIVAARASKIVLLFSIGLATAIMDSFKGERE